MCFKFVKIKFFLEFSEKFCIFDWKATALKPLFNNVADLKADVFLTQVFSCGISKIIEKTYFEENMRKTVFEYY